MSIVKNFINIIKLYNVTKKLEQLFVVNTNNCPVWNWFSKFFFAATSTFIGVNIFRGTLSVKNILPHYW